MKLLKIFGLGAALGQRVPIRVPNNIDLEQLQSEAISSLQGSMAGKNLLKLNLRIFHEKIFQLECCKIPKSEIF